MRWQEVRLLAELRIPLQRVQIHQHRSAGVGDVSEVLAALNATGQVLKHVK